MAVLSEVSFLSFCQPRETGQGASSSHNPQSSVSDCGKRALNANIKKKTTTKTKTQPIPPQNLDKIFKALRNVRY